jgi:SseB protein C-terminal domain
VAVLPDTTQFYSGSVGSCEEELIGQLTDLFQRDTNIAAAYLVCATLENRADPVIVVAVRANLRFGPEQLRAVGHITASILGVQREAQIVLLSENLEQKLAAMSKPFFQNKS